MNQTEQRLSKEEIKEIIRKKMDLKEIFEVVFNEEHRVRFEKLLQQFLADYRKKSSINYLFKHNFLERELLRIRHTAMSK